MQTYRDNSIQIINNNSQQEKKDEKGIVVDEGGEDYIKKIPTILLLNIINHVDDNVDLVCLLFSCKRLFNFTSAVNSNITFKKDEIVDFECIYYSQKCYHLKSFKKMFTNTFSDTMIITDNFKTPDMIEENIKNVVLLDLYQEELLEESIEPSTLSIPRSTTLLELQRPIYDPLPTDYFPPLLQHLTITYGEKNVADRAWLPDSLKSLTMVVLDRGFTSPKALPVGLESLEYRDHHRDTNISLLPRWLGLDRLGSLKSLTSDRAHDEKGVAYSTLPQSLTNLGLYLDTSPLSTYFEPLSKLVHLDISFCGRNGNQPTDQHSLLYFDSLVSLETLQLGLIGPIHASQIRLAPRLLKFKQTNYDQRIGNLTNQFFPPTLTCLSINLDTDDFTMLSLSSCLPQLTWLSIKCLSSNVPVEFIPPSIKTLEIYNHVDVTQLYKLHNSIEKLVLWNLKHQIDMDTPITLPDGLQKFTWVHYDKFSSSSSNKRLEVIYPPTLKYIDYSQFRIPYQNIIPTSVNEFKYTTKPKTTTTINNNNNNNNTTQIEIHSIGDDGFVFPSTLTKLTATIRCNDILMFGLDQVINQTNVDQLLILGPGFTFKVHIRRLDPENRNVLIIGKSLYGGIIHQHIDQQLTSDGEQQYRPIYILIQHMQPPILSYDIPNTLN
ncbi:hypothetical protein DFA_02059 [Cavenderia fasciculata]|uniref:Uncharacterized protein n=1 Tax=Cavenderia fasciculata TaxID=261658 RepID=F4PYK6_CACFS|nr:uncharacterized protein DFA_02059 [Cavenderia fasciculata]EGG19272.1 hypothetical protein DFA_02059 [Cavenderia fasciculata]|eukprot:XP_004357543.1 hypothetical protein DFA_02059 [Cavenderia fasciculata]